MGTAASTFTVRSTADLFKLQQGLLIITSSLYDAVLGKRNYSRPAFTHMFAAF
jgi:hypothetical protein